MYAFHVTMLVLAASAVVPSLSAPLATPDGSSLAARDPVAGPSVDEIRDLPNNLNLRSEDVFAALYGREDTTDPISNAPSKRSISTDHVISARDDSGIDPYNSSRPGKPSGFDAIQGRGFPHKLRDDEIRDLLNHLNLRSEDVIAALYGREDTTDPISNAPISRSTTAKSFLRSFSRDNLGVGDRAISARDAIDNIQTRSFFGSLKDDIESAGETVKTALQSALD